MDPTPLLVVLFALASSTADEIDSKLIAQKIKNGDHQAFQSFFDTHFESLYRFLTSKNTSAEVAKDLIQQAFIYIWEHRNSIDADKSLRAYIFKIAYTRMLNYHRDHKKFGSMDDLPKQQSNLTPEDEAQANDLECAIDNTIENMPEKRGTVFQLCFMEGFTYKEAAATLEVSVKTVENHMGLALKDMRQALKQFR